MSSNNTTVDQLLIVLQELSDQHKGDYVVTCNKYNLVVSKDNLPDVDDENKVVDIGGCDQLGMESTLYHAKP